MRLRNIVVILLSVGAAFAQQAPQAKPAPEPVTPEAIAQANSAALAAARRLFPGRSDQPAETVFQNIKVMKGIPAGKFLDIMETGFSKSLGVSCAHCHDGWLFAKDDKPAKQIARDMWGMTHTINAGLLKNIAGLKDRDPVVNCTTCHRGQLKPALNLDTQGNDTQGKDVPKGK